MGKPSLKKKRGGGAGHKASDHGAKPSTLDRSGSKVLDGDETIFAEMARELREEGNKLFQRRDYDRALLAYEKSLKLLPSPATGPAAAADVAGLRSNLAACYMQMAPPDHYRAVNECNLALDAAPRYGKALLKRARCFEALGRLDLAARDVERVLAAEPGNLTAVDLGERVRRAMVEKGFVVDEKAVMQTPEEVVAAAPKQQKPRNKKKGRKAAAKAAAAAVEEEGNPAAAEPAPAAPEEEPPRQVKLVFGEDIRWAQVPASCGMAQLREAVRGKFPGLKAVLVKYRDREGDLVTITNQDELKWAEELVDPGSSLRLYVTEADPEHEPYLEDANSGSLVNNTSDNGSIRSNNRQDEDRSTVTCIDDWIVQFARLFKNHVGVSSDEYLDLHEVSMKLYTEAIEDTITSDEAQEVFQLAEGNFQEMAALAFFQWGNVHMSRARKRLLLPEDSTKELVLEKVKEAYEWAKEEYSKAGKMYEEAVRAKPDFFEGFLALAHQQFEQAKLSWYYAVGSSTDLDTWPSSEVLELFNRAEDNMEKGTEMWEEIEEQRLKNRSKPSQENAVLEKMGMEEYIKDVSTDDAAERASNMRSQINILWGMLLYERSVVEFKLGLPMWEDCLMAAIEKFKLGGASATNIAVLVKNHCANETAQDGLGFNVDEIVQAWNEMYDIKRWLRGVPSFRLEPLFRRRVPQLHTALEHI
ncbi:protein PHOX1-like [Lolium rigidum]|uniref:protein PHOX1-like n=1 Tax=Lolium rigidum TaxID=89674 RepID=UPI001F5DB30A|nr:protein PHOX1-like [Lolium rigidum]